MKRLFTGCLLLLGVILFLWKFSTSPESVSDAPEVYWPPAQSPVSIDNTSGENPAPAAPPSTGESGLPPGATDRFRALRDYSLSRDGPVSLYGLVLDQGRRPVPGAVIELELRQADSELLERTNLLEFKMGDELLSRTLTVTSGPNGRFEVIADHGRLLTLQNVTRPGYQWIVPSEINFSFLSRHTPQNMPYADPARGITVHLWEKGPTQPLVPIWHRVNLPHGDGSVRLNLLLGKTDNAAAADLEFSTRLLFPGDA
ncbi:MAG: hypothetical protein ACKVYV_18320, partial [Limisphaerales bacterium]